MKTLIAVLAVIIVALGGWYLWKTAGIDVPSTGTPTTTPNETIPFEQTQSDGTITFGVPDDFGMAIRPDQILVESTVPPCDDGFAYCLYYNGDAYEATTFETAGISIGKLASLSTENSCLQTPPTGFSASTTPSGSRSASGYAASVFTDVGDSGAGHTVSGNAYRLFVRESDTCYDFTTRISVASAGEGTAFSAANRAAIESTFESVLDNVLFDGEKVVFPAAQ